MVLYSGRHCLSKGGDHLILRYVALNYFRELLFSLSSCASCLETATELYSLITNHTVHITLELQSCTMYEMTYDIFPTLSIEIFSFIQVKFRSQAPTVLSYTPGLAGLAIDGNA